MKKILVSLLTVTMLSGCASTRTYMVPQTVTDNIESVYHDGYPVAVSTGQESAVVAKLDEGNSYLILDVCYKNLSEVKIDAVPTDITVTGIGKKGKEKDLKVYSASKILADMRTKQVIGSILMGVSAACSTIGAGRSTAYHSGNVYGNTSGSIYGSNGSYASYSGSGSGSYSGTTTTYDPAKAAVAQQTANQKVAAYAQATQATYNATEQGLLKRTTLFPNHYAEGTVCIQKKKATKYIITIPFGSDEHRVEFVPTKIK